MKKMLEKFDDLIEKIGDPYFSVAPDEQQDKNCPYVVDIWDCECETCITISCADDCLEIAKALVTVLNGDFRYPC